MSQCSVGGGTAAARMAQLAMYEEEVPVECIRLMYDLGPDCPSLLHIICASMKKGLSSSFSSTKDMLATVRQSVQNVRLIFAYTAANCVGGLCQEYPHGGTTRSDGKTIEMQPISSNVQGHSSFQLQQARLEGHCTREEASDRPELWNGIGGIRAILYVLSSMTLTIAENVNSALLKEQSHLVIECLRLCKSLTGHSLLDSIDMLQCGGFHMLRYFLKTLPLGSLSEDVATTAIDFAFSFTRNCPSAPREISSVSNLNPAQAVAIKCFVMDFDMWTRFNIESQLTVIDRVLNFAITDPSAYGKIVGMEYTIDVIRLFYCDPGRRNRQVRQEQKLKSTALDSSLQSLVKRAVQLLCEIVFVCVCDSLTTEDEPYCMFSDTDSTFQCKVGLTAWCAVKGLIRLLVDCQDSIVGPILIGTIDRMLHLNETAIGTALLCHDALGALCVTFQRRSEKLPVCLPVPLFPTLFSLFCLSRSDTNACP